MNEKIRILPLGGLEQIGMNITLFEYKHDIIILDCGIAFPEDEMLGVDLVIPNTEYLLENIDRVKGVVLTHGHEDHIGALPYILKEIQVPVYGTKLTLALVENKLIEHKINDKISLNQVALGQSVRLGSFRVEYIRTNHSIADAAALAIHTKAGVIVHSGDFKVDYNPIYGSVIDLARFAELGKEGVLALLCDSTNVETPGYTMSESTVGESFNEIFNQNKASRIIVATFSSNVDRIQQIIDAARAHKRKVVFEGRSMVNVATTAMDLGYLKIPPNMLISINDVDNYKDSQLVIITTGSQGEPMAALSRMAQNIHRKISIKENDLVIFSSAPIPGNEKGISRSINELFKKGAKVIYENAHVSGHACQEELKILHTLVKPKFFIPVHGEYRHLKIHAELAMSLGMNKKNIYILKNGDVFELGKSGGKVVGEVPSRPRLVDGLGIGDVGNAVLKERHKLSQNGLVIVNMIVDANTRQLIKKPEIVSKGFVFIKTNEDLIEGIEECAESIYYKYEARQSQEKLKNTLRQNIGDYLWAKLKRNPFIIILLDTISQ